MTPPEEDKARLAARLAADYLLRSVRMISELSGGDLLTGLVSLALVQANVAHLDREANDFNRIDTVPPDEVRRPISVLALSASLGLPYETTRRHVAKMVAAGLCVRVKGGVMIPTAIVEDRGRSGMLEANLLNLRRLVRSLRNAGINFD